MARHNWRAYRGALRLVLKALPGGDRVAYGLEIEAARQRINQHVENQRMAGGGIDKDRCGPKRPSGAAWLFLAVVAVVSCIESLFGRRLWEDHRGRTS